MIQTEGKAPGVEFYEQVEEATRALGVANAIGIVGVAKKGPTTLTLLSSPQQCISIFGEPHANNSAIKGVLACLQHSREVYFKRVVSADGKPGTTWDETSGSPAPWITFTTKDTTDAYNGYSVSLEWSNVGTVDIPVYKVNYKVMDAAGNSVECYLCDEDASAPLYIETIVNRFSNYVTAKVTGTIDTRDAITYVIAGGNSGLNATADDIVGTGNTGMKAFYDPESVDISTLVVPGWADEKVWDEGVKIAEYRKDIVFIPSLPTGLDPKSVALLVRGQGQYLSNAGRFNKTYMPLYWPNGLVRNTKTGALEVVDIAPYVAATYAKSDADSEIWFAPAGIKRGVISGLDGLEYKTTKEERDELYATDLNVNSIVNLRGYGITIMGARTSKVYNIMEGNTALRYINIRRMCNYIRKVVLSESLHNLFDQNDSYTWNDWKMRIDPHLRAIKEGRGLYDYMVVMDETTVTQADIDAGRMPGIIKVAPIKPNEYIVINFVVAKDGTVSFTDEVETTAIA